MIFFPSEPPRLLGAAIKSLCVLLTLKEPADIRRRSIIKSEFGNLMIIPRERKLVRMYVQVSSGLVEIYRASDRDPEVIMQAVRKIMQPYRFDASRLEWSTIYSVSEEP